MAETPCTFLQFTSPPSTPDGADQGMQAGNDLVIYLESVKDMVGLWPYADDRPKWRLCRRKCRKCGGI
jgi:hypothetical protein